MVIDDEILDYIDKFSAGLELSEEPEIGIIEEVGHGGSFLEHKSTVEHFRSVFWEPELFSLNPLYSWAAQGKPDVLEKAREKLKSLEVSEGPVVAEDVQRELRAIEQKFGSRL